MGRYRYTVTGSAAARRTRVARSNGPSGGGGNEDYDMPQLPPPNDFCASCMRSSSKSTHSSLSNQGCRSSSLKSDHPPASTSCARRRVSFQDAAKPFANSLSFQGSNQSDSAATKLSRDLSDQLNTACQLVGGKPDLSSSSLAAGSAERIRRRKSTPFRPRRPLRSRRLHDGSSPPSNDGTKNERAPTLPFFKTNRDTNLSPFSPSLDHTSTLALGRSSYDGAQYKYAQLHSTTSKATEATMMTTSPAMNQMFGALARPTLQRQQAYGVATDRPTGGASPACSFLKPKCSLGVFPWVPPTCLDGDFVMFGKPDTSCLIAGDPVPGSDDDAGIKCMPTKMMPPKFSSVTDLHALDSDLFKLALNSPLPPDDDGDELAVWVAAENVPPNITTKDAATNTDPMVSPSKVSSDTTSIQKPPSSMPSSKPRKTAKRAAKTSRASNDAEQASKATLTSTKRSSRRAPVDLKTPSVMTRSISDQQHVGVMTRSMTKSTGKTKSART